MAVAGDRTIDQARVYRVQRLVSEPEPVQRAWAEILDQNVRPLDQAVEELAASILFEIERDTKLGAINREIICALTLNEWRSVASGIIPVRRGLHFDDLGAKVRQYHGGERPRENSRKIQDTNSR